MSRAARIAIFLGMLALVSTARAQILNLGFDAPNTIFAAPNYSASLSGSGTSGPSSASNWSLYNNAASTTTTSLLASTAPAGSGYMLQLSTGGGYNGLYQVFPLNSGGSFGLTLDVNVSSGQLYFASYKDSGSTLQSSVLTNTALNGQWQTIYLPLSNPFNELVIYSGPTGGASFSIDNLQFVPEPSTVALIVVGGVLVLWRARRRIGSGV